MPLKQTTLFSFDNEPEEPNAEPVIAPPGDTLESNDNKAEVKIDATDIVFNPAKKSTRGRKNLHDIINAAGIIDVPEDDILFQKKYYSIGAVADMFKVNISLIRYWEKEFDILKPKKNAKGDRYFRPEDVKNLKLIHHLLREKKYTIKGATDFLKKNKNSEEVFSVIEELKKMKHFLTDLKLSI